LAFYIRWHVPESEAWKEHAHRDVQKILKILIGYWRPFAYLCVLMTLFMFLSHGTQDLYPDFLREVHKLPPIWISYVAIIYNIGAIVGAVIFGIVSQSFGRRRGIALALLLSIITVPAWAFGSGLIMVGIAAFFMQVGVQGAWGVVPVHLNELAPDAARSLVPGFAYQLGILFASPTNTIEYALRNHYGYRSALAGFEIVTIILLAIVVMLGREAHGKQFTRSEILEIDTAQVASSG
jgi:MFS transporter, SHS family, lactate transporter